MSTRETSDSALVDRLREAIGHGAVTAVAGAKSAADADERTSRHVSGRSAGVPICWVRPTSTEDVRAVVATADRANVNVVAVGAATTFWGGLDVQDAVALDTLSLREPFVIDADARVAWVGAGRSIREVDQAARRHGLCVAARPDAAGDTPFGSVLAVGSTSGLGMGHGLAIEQIAGATAVTGTGAVVRLGASHALTGVPNGRYGLPNALDLLSAAEGRGAIVTELGVLLRRAPHVAVARGARPTRGAAGWDELAPLLALARAGLDRGCVDTFRFEQGSDAPSGAGRAELFVRAYSDVAAERAADDARALGERARDLGYALDAVAVESEAARRGDDGEYEFHWSFAPAEHRARLKDGAFWGAEVTVPWGRGLEATILAAARLFDQLATVDPLHRRFAVYPGHHLVSVGVHVLAPRAPGYVDRTLEVLRGAGDELLRHGVPYRKGALWREAVDGRLARDEAIGTRDLVEGLFRAMDPRAVVGPRAVPAKRNAAS